MSGILRTFGKTKAAIILAERVCNDKKTFSRVARLLTRYRAKLMALSSLDKSIKSAIAFIIYNHYLNLAKSEPITYNTFLTNIISTDYKIWLFENEIESEKQRMKSKRNQC